MNSSRTPWGWRIAIVVVGVTAGVVWMGDGNGWWNNLAVTSSRPAAAVAAAATTVPSAAVETVTVTITGPALQGDVLIANGHGAIQYTNQHVTLPFTWKDGNYPRSSGIYVTVKGWDAPSVSCQLAVNGYQISVNSTTGGTAICED